MKKFVIKNRRKRKYVKKSEKASIYTFSKTLYGILPLLILSVAFMATIVISTSFRHSLSHINFKIQIQMPSLSLTNPLLFFQTLLFDVMQMINICGAILSLLWTSVVNITLLTIIAMSRIIASLNPLPVFSSASTATAQDVGSTGETLTNAGSILAGMLTTFWITVSTSIATILNHIIHLFITSEQLLAIISTSSLQMIMQLVTACVQNCSTTVLLIARYVVQISILVFEFTFYILSLVWQWFNFFMTTVGHVLSNFIHQVISLIEIPFKTLAAFGLSLMPYVNFLGHHISQTGMDFKSAVKSFNSAASAISTYKRT